MNVPILCKLVLTIFQFFVSGARGSDVDRERGQRERAVAERIHPSVHGRTREPRWSCQTVAVRRGKSESGHGRWIHTTGRSAATRTRQGKAIDMCNRMLPPTFPP